MILYACILIFTILVGMVFLTRSQAKRLMEAEDIYTKDDLHGPMEGEEKTLQLTDGTNIVYKEAGEGSLVVLLHGYGMNYQSWRLVWNRLLAMGYKVLAFDIRGHGKSSNSGGEVDLHKMARDFEEVFETLDLKDVVLTGHSLGGFISIVCSVNSKSFQERIKGICFVASGAGIYTKKAVANYLTGPMLKYGISQAMIKSDSLATVMSANVFGDDPSPSGIQALIKQMKTHSSKDFGPFFRDLRIQNYYPKLTKIHVPCKVIAGEKDKTVHPWHSNELIHGLPNVDATWVKGKGHMLNWEAPGHVVEAIDALHRE